ncbi:hypothetical protein FI667_g11552, partial [Globisporangium splendens]
MLHRHQLHGGGGGGAGASSPFTTPEEAFLMGSALARDSTQTMRWRSSSKTKDSKAATVAATDGSSIVKEGFLTKKGHVLRTQKERYFVLRQHTLSYFRMKRSEKKAKSAIQPSTLKGVLELTASDIVTPAPHSDQWFRIQKLPDAEGKVYKLDLKAMHAASLRRPLNRTAARHGRDFTILSARMNYSPSVRGTLLAEEVRTASKADLRASFMIFHELVLLQKLLEEIKSSWGPPTDWSCEQYQELVQSIYLAQEKSGVMQLEGNSILAEAFQLRYQFEEIAENQPKIKRIQEAQQENIVVTLEAPDGVTREASSSIVLPVPPPRLRCPTIYGYYSTFEQLAFAASDAITSEDSADRRSSSGATLPLTPRSATIAKYAHLYLEDDVRTKAPWSWERSEGDDLLEGWKHDTHEASRIIDALVERFSHDRIYTNVNDHAMVLLNPYRVLQTSKFASIYDEHVVLTYAMTPFAQTQLAPHPFAMAKQSLVRLFYNPVKPHQASDGTRTASASPSPLPTQTILLSGESGSGKTELSKELLKYFVLSAQPTSMVSQGSCPKVKLFTSSTKSTIQMRTEEARTMALLEAKGVDNYEIVLLDLYPERWPEMTNVSKSKRIPQVHIDGLFFGFYEKLESLEDEEQLRMYFKNPHAAKKLSTVLDSNVLLEAFGNATTSMNLNSSRFGKATNLFFSFDRHPSQYQILGCRLAPFLLETTRVTSVRENRPTDMNFHVFYALVAGVNAMPYMRLLAKELRLDSASCETFVYLGKCKHKLQGAWTEEETWKKDVERWQHIVDAMSSVNLTADQQRTIFQVLSAILWLGNIDFEWNNKSQKLNMVSPSNHQAEKKVIDLLGLSSVEKLESMLLTKRINLASTGESFDVSLEKGQVSHLRDTLARLLYQAVFFYLVEQMNEATRVDDASLLNDGGENNDQVRALKLVDVFGFENLSRNSLEQLCINYLSEKLFAAEEQVVSIHYRHDRIRQSATGEKDVLSLFEHPLGIFASLEELTVLHQGENENWQQEQKKNQLLVRNLYERNATRLLEPPRSTGVSGQQWKKALPFVVPHSRESVIYDATEFVKKNSDFQQSSLLDSLESSAMADFQQMIALMKIAFSAPTNKKSKASSSSITGSQVNQFRAQIQALTVQDGDHMPLYMHCIRPNSTGRPSQIEAEVVAQQVTSQRIPSQIQLCGESLASSPVTYFPIQIPEQLLVTRYRSLLPQHKARESTALSDSDLRQWITDLLAKDIGIAHSAIDRGGTQWEVDVSESSVIKFQSCGIVEKLDLLLEIRQIEASTMIQSFFRMVKARSKFLAKQQHRTSVTTELLALYGDANKKKVEKILKKYDSKEDELREKIASKKKKMHEEHAQVEELMQNLQTLCLTREGGLQAETVNEILSNASICTLLQQNEVIVGALRDMSLNPEVLVNQLANPILRSFYQTLVSVLREKRALDAAHYSQEIQQHSNNHLPLEDRVAQLVESDKVRWQAAATQEEWMEHRDKLEEIGDEPELLLFHLEDPDFVIVLEAFVSKLEVQKTQDDAHRALEAKRQEQAAAVQAHELEVEAELLEMLLKVELDESLMAAMRRDSYFIQALQNPELISSMQQDVMVLPPVVVLALCEFGSFEEGKAPSARLTRFA